MPSYSPFSQIHLEPKFDVASSLRNFVDRFGFERSVAPQLAWAIVLARHQGQDTVVFALSANDNGGGAKSVVNYFSTTVKLRKGVTIFKTLQTLQKEFISYKENTPTTGLSEIIAQAKNHQTSIPFAIQSILQVMDHEADVPIHDLSDIDVPLVVRLSALDGLHPHATIRHRAGISDLAAKSFGDHFLSALEGILASDVETRIDDIDLLSAKETAFLLERARPSNPPSTELLHALFEKQALSKPDTVAIENENGSSMTYYELNAAADCVSRALSCGPGSIVPVCIGPSNMLVVALLAILKTGAAYVIIDPEYPKERQKLIADEVKALFVLVSGGFHPQLPYRMIDVEKVLEIPSGDWDVDSRVKIDEKYAAYVIYTSGSTGTPKGVILEHGAVTSGIMSAPKQEGLRSLLFYNPVFSAAQRTIWTTLVQGGCLCIASKNSLASSLSATVSRMNVNQLGITPSTARLLSPESVPSLKRLTLTGERVSADVIHLWADKLDLKTGYGLSEVTQLVWTASLGHDSTPNDIGRPKDTTSAYVLVPGTLKLAPVLMAGELCLAGPQLARSYLNRPDETARKFIENPFGPGRLYRTGDLAICRENGNIEILGRIDRQVKIAGQRIEPEEVAAVIRNSSVVEDAVVVPVTLESEIALVACIVLKGSVDNTALEIVRSEARQVLPSFAIPFCVPMNKLPLNHNGKTDLVAIQNHLTSIGRQGMLRLAQADADLSENSRPDWTVDEQIMRRIWSAALSLNVETVRQSDSFLALGGSSLRAIQVSIACREEGIDVSAADIIRANSLASLVESMQQNGGAKNRTAAARAPMIDISLLDNNVKAEEYTDILPVSPLQEAVVATTLSGAPEYTYQRVFKIKDDVNLPRLKAAFESVAHAQSILRTTFLPYGSSFVQAVLPGPLPWSEHYEMLDEYLSSDLKRGFVAKESFCRVAIFPTQSLLVFTTHHALFDFWSNNFVFDDVAKVYHGYVPSYRPPYRSFIEHISSSPIEDSHKFWEEYLDGASTSRIGIVGGPKHVSERTLDVDISRFLTSHSITSGALIYAAWALIVSAHTSSSDVTFGTTLSGRDAPIKDIHLMNGPTLTTVPQRIQIEFTQNAVQYVSTVQERLWTMNEHSQFGMRNALRASHQTSSLFDTLVNLLVTKQVVDETLSVFQPYGPSPAWETEYTTLEAIPDESTFRFRLISHLEARRSDFIVESLVSVINSLITEPYSKLSDIGLVGRAEIDYLKSLSPPTLPQHPGSFLHSSFEDFASNIPRNTAIQWEDSESISYDQLNSRANRLAAILRGKGIGPGVKVPLCLEKSVVMVVCILAVLKAGGAYVPLDHENPPERNMFIAGDVEATLVLTTAEHSDVFANIRAEVLCVEDLDLRGSWPNVPVPDLTPDCLAYIIYTSGSTGTPKGVLIQHSAVSVAMQSLIEVQGCDATWRALQFTNYVFDVSVSDIFTTLGAGGTICMASTARLLSDLAQCINMMGVTHMFLTPTVAKLIWPKDVPNVKVLFVGGESLAQDVVSRWAAEVDMRQGYGPTEASVFSTFGAVPSEANGKIIGKPLESLSALILEANSLRMAPYGAVGELCLSGPQLAQGYLKRQEATDAAFVDRDGTRIYRTGDLARWLPDGQIECFGRKDHQVKIAGHRIELGEIEQAILTSGSNLIHDCVVGVLDAQGKPQLAAFVVFSGQTPDENLVLSSGSHSDEIVSVSIGLSTLPPYMVPKTWIPMSQIPLLLSGKADRKRLVRLAQDLNPLELSRYSSGGGSAATTTYVAPETDEEKLHQKVWSEIMNISKEAIGATSSFFAFGGDSITAINLVSKFRKAGYSLAVGDILAFPVLRDMAARMKPIRSTSSLGMPVVRTLSSSELQSLEAAGVREEDIEIVLPAGPGQTEFLNMSRHGNQYWRMQATRELPKDFDVDRWSELTKRLTVTNSILRTLYVNDEHHSGGWLQIVLKKPVVDFEIVAAADETEKDKFIEDEWRTLFKLDKPLLRYRLIKLPDDRRFLTIKLDHGSYDGTLLRILDTQFIAMSRDQPFEKPVPFQNFVSQIHHTDKTPALRFWQELLKNNTFTFPSALSETPYATGTMLRKVNSRIDAFAAQTSVTASIVFQAAYTLLLSHLSGSVDVSYDNLVIGRDIDALDGQLINGTCANFVPFRSSYDPDGTTVRNFLTETQATFWKTMEHGILSLTEMHGTLKDIGGRNKCLFLFQPFEPASGPVNHMRWVVLALSKTRQPVNYAIMMEVFKNAAEMGYTVRFKYDERVFGEKEMEDAGDWIIRILENMMQRSSSTLVNIL